MIEVRTLDLREQTQARAFVELLQHYAQSPSGGGKALEEAVVQSLPGILADWPGFVGFMAWSGELAVGLINCFTGFSTFRASPLLNVHDLVVREGFRRAGVASALFAAVEEAARQRACCKLTLEVLSGNTAARMTYAKLGFLPYELDPAMGAAIFMEKLLS